jgi:hypothetical protein
MRILPEMATVEQKFSKLGVTDPESSGLESKSSDGEGQVTGMFYPLRSSEAQSSMTSAPGKIVTKDSTEAELVEAMNRVRVTREEVAGFFMKGGVTQCPVCQVELACFHGFGLAAALDHLRIAEKALSERLEFLHN